MKFILMALFAMCFICARAAENVPGTDEIINALSPQKGIVLRNIGVQKSGNASTENGVKPNISLSIRFDFNSARINSASEPVLRNLANALASSELQGGKYLIEGHTDAKGGDTYNLRLSQQRADAVLQWLTKRGIADENLSTIGKGATELAVPDDPYSGENRRVVITLQ